MDDSLESSDYYREPPGIVQRLKRKATSDSGITELLPVILHNAEEKPLKSYNPIFIDQKFKEINRYLPGVYSLKKWQSYDKM